MTNPRHALFACLCAAWLAGSLPSVAQAQSTADLLQRGNSALLRGETDAALRAYDALAESGISDPDLEYNRALAQARTGHLGAAVLHLERSRVLLPGDPQVLGALERVQEALGQRLAEREGEATLRTRPPLLEALASLLSDTTWAWLLWLAVATASGMWVLLLRAERESLRLAGGVALAIALGLGIASASALSIEAGWTRNGQRAVVVHADLALRDAPDAKAPRVRSLPEGSRALVLESRGRYARVQAGESSGWVDAAGIGTY